MPVLRFKAAKVKRCIEHAYAATEFDMGHENMTDEQFQELGLEPPTDRTPVGPGLVFVHDRGVYLMSNGIPRDIEGVDSGSHVVYAEHCNPNTDDEWYDNSRELVGGDDFAEVINIPRSWVQNCDHFETFEIVLTDSTLNCGFVDPTMATTI
jgi:hypothetical protein